MSLHFLKSLLIATILTLTVVPIFLLIASDTKWTTIATLIWTIVTILVFYPSIRYIYPHLMSKIGVYLLSAILIIISTWFNIMIIQLLLPYNYIYYALFNATLFHIIVIGSIYLIVINAIISNLILLSHIEFYEEERLF